MYAVTARHVIDGLKRTGLEEGVLRLNRKASGDTFINHNVPLSHWFVHPSDISNDVALIEMGIPVDADHLVIPMQLAVTDETISKYSIELGDEVFISGLFWHHYGNKRNIPIVRVGYLAALNEEKISTKLGEIDGYLVDTISTGGLSGSPVFVNLGSIQSVFGQLRIPRSGGKPIIFLLGMIHGHFGADDKPDAEAARDAINSGIAIVVAARSILAVIEAYESDDKEARNSSGIE